MEDLKNLIKYFLVVLIMFRGDVSSVIIRLPPANVTVLQGGEARFLCQIREQRGTDYVFWKKVNNDGFTNIISYNRNVVNTKKYAVESDYTMRVRDVTLDDEAWYECQAGVDRAKAFLSVSVMSANMTLSVYPAPPFTGSTLVNLTCHAHHSRPPADIHWFHGKTDVTTLSSVTCLKAVGDDGFGSTSSVLTVAISNDGLSYRCVASLPGTDATLDQIFSPLTYGASSAASSVIPDVLIMTMIFLISNF